MKKFLIALLMVGIACSFVYAQAGGRPSTDESWIKIFTDYNQTTSEKFVIKTIVWVSASGDEIGATDGFELEDANGLTIAACEATALTSGCQMTYEDGLAVNGMYLRDRDAGYIYVYGKRR
jgi:hypothetical protein